MTLNEAMNFIHRESWKGSRLGLTRIKDLLNRIDNPENSLKFIHVAGTNGKGSVCAMLSEILVQSRYKTGRYISPFIEDFNERMTINNINISNDELIELVKEIKPYVDEMEEKPTEFELITALAFLYFKKNNCDIVVLEVGLGGRLDSTNVISTSLVQVITGIGIDHSDILGSTIEEIAREKAGIIKKNSVVVLSDEDERVVDVIETQAKELNTSLMITDKSKLKIISKCLDYQEIDYRNRKNLRLSLLGHYQCNNLMVVLDVIDVLIDLGYKITDDSIYSGLLLTKWPGRFELIQKEPICLIDGAHNPQAVEALTKSVKEYFPDKKITFIMGVMKDKSYVEMLETLIPFAKKFILVTPKYERSLSSDILENELKKIFQGEIINAIEIEKAIDKIFDTKCNEEIFCILGSLYMIGEVKTAFRKYRNI